MKKKAQLTAIVGSVIAVTVAAVILLLLRLVIMPDIVNHISLLDSTSEIAFNGTFQDTNGSSVAVTSVEFQPKEDGVDTITGTTNSGGGFTAEGMEYDISYQLTITTTDGNTYTTEVLFFLDNEEMSYSDMVDGIDFALTEADDDTITAVLSLNDAGNLTCTTCS